jgi:NAD(P)-dependent dehydrogenase (short-subunit alcohol dehydrogenase family)
MGSKRLEGKVALISGGTRGIGLAMARAMLAEGGHVMIASRKQDGVDAALRELESKRPADGTWGRLVGRAAHVGDGAQCHALVAATEGELGTIDVLVNNAGTNPFFGPLLQISESAFDKTFEVNLKSAWRLSVAVAKRLTAEKRQGSIINVASVLGVRAAPLQGCYGMTKAAMVSLTRTLAVELGAARIRVNAIAPGLIDTKLASAITASDELQKVFLDRTALRRVGRPDEVAPLAVFLASDESAYITGATFPVDAGYLAM